MTNHYHCHAIIRLVNFLIRNHISYNIHGLLSKYSCFKFKQRTIRAINEEERIELIYNRGISTLGTFDPHNNNQLK